MDCLAGLIGSVVSKWPVFDAEQRVGVQLAELTAGVAGRVPYLGTTQIDDTFLARVFEFLIHTAGASRVDARRLETEGLGYANLLELAVILAAIAKGRQLHPRRGLRQGLAIGLQDLRPRQPGPQRQQGYGAPHSVSASARIASALRWLRAVVAAFSARPSFSASTDWPTPCGALK